MFSEENWSVQALRFFQIFFGVATVALLTVATPNEFFSFKKSNNSIKNNSFSFIDSNVSHNQNTKHKTKSISYYNSKVESEQENKKRKKKSKADLTQSGDGETDEALLGERRSPPAFSFRRHLISTCLLPLSLFCVLSPPLFLLFSLM